MQQSPAKLLKTLLSSAPDWDLFPNQAAWGPVQKLAEEQGVGALVAFLIRDRVQSDTRAWCDKVLTRSWMRHDAGLSQIGSIITLLDDAGIRSIALKGPILARRLYSPPFIRKASGDLDLAVMLRDLEHAAAVMQGAGFSLGVPIQEATSTGYHLIFRQPGRLPVEVHFRLSHGVLGIDVEQFFDRAVRYQIPDGPVAWVLDPADELLHLILHLVDDRFATLFHSFEVRHLWLAATPELRQRVIRKAVEHRFAGVVALCDVAMKSIWGESLLSPEMELPRTWLHWRIKERLFLEMTDTAGHGLEQPLRKRVRGRWLDLQTTDGPADALRRVSSLVRVAAGQIRGRNWASGRLPRLED